MFGNGDPIKPQLDFGRIDKSKVDNKATIKKLNEFIIENIKTNNELHKYKLEEILIKLATWFSMYKIITHF